MRTIVAILAALALSGCASFKAGQFGACIVTGRAVCMIQNAGEQEAPRGPGS